MIKIQKIKTKKNSTKHFKKYQTAKNLKNTKKSIKIFTYFAWEYNFEMHWTIKYQKKDQEFKKVPKEQKMKKYVMCKKGEKYKINTINLKKISKNLIKY